MDEISDWQDVPINDWQDAPKGASHQIGRAEDIIKSLAGGIERGAAAVPMVIPNLLNQAVAGPQLLGRGIADTISPLLGVPAQARGELWQPFYSSEEVLQMLPEPLRPHTPQTIGGVGTDLVGQMIGGVMAGKALSPSTKIPDSDAVKKAAQNSYADADMHDGILLPNRTNAWIDDLDNVLPQTEKGKILAGDSPVTKVIQKIRTYRDQGMGLKEAQEIDEILGDAIDAEFRLGGISKQGKKIIEVQDKLRDMIAKSNPSDVIGGKKGFEHWKNGQKLWADHMKMRDIERIIDRASMMDNPVTGLKTGFRNLATNPSRLRGFTPAERKLINNAAKTGSLTEIAKTFGSRLIPIGSLVSGNGIGPAIAAQAGATAARSGASKLQLKRAEKLLSSIAKNSGVKPPNVQPAINPLANPKTAALLGGIGSEIIDDQEDGFKKGGHVKSEYVPISSRNLTAEFLARKYA